MQVNLRGSLAVLFSGLLISAAVIGAPPQGELRVVPVAGGVSTLISGRGGNIGVFAGDDGVVMIDSLFAQDVEAVRAALGKVSREQPVFLVNTHAHGDHTGGNPDFAGTATVIAHTNVRDRLKAEDRAVGGLPVVTFDERLVLHFNGEDVAIFHVGPGHTDGDAVVWFQGSKVVHMGDLFFNGSYPFIDLDRGGDVEGYLAAIRAVLKIVPADVRVIPGHGEVTGIAGLRENLAVLEEIVGRFREALAEGSSPEEVLSLDLTADFDPTWGQGFIKPERMARTIVESLSR